MDDNVTLESHVAISGKTFIGKGTKVWPFASIGSDPQDLKYFGEKTALTIGQNNLIRECVSISIGTAGGGGNTNICLLYTSPSPRDATLSRMPSSA